MNTQNIPVYLLPYYQTTGLTVLNSSTTPNTQLILRNGQTRDFNNEIDMPLNAPVTIDATKNGLNGLDVGSLGANKVYEVFVIADSTNQRQVASIISVDSITNPPYLPFGYDSYGAVGYAFTDGSSHFIPMFCSGNGITGGRTLMFNAPQATAVTAGTATSYTAVDLSHLVPTNHGSQFARTVIIQSIFTPNAASDKLFLQPAAGTGDMIVINGQVASVPVITYSYVPATYTNNVMSINYKVSSGSDAVAISVAGFIF